MQCRVRDLHVLAHAAGFTMWLYDLGADPLRAALSPGYFDCTTQYIQRGDIITARSPTSTAMLAVTRVDTITGQVTVALMVAAAMEPAVDRAMEDAA